MNSGGRDSTPLNSGLYTGTVRHTRLRPFRHRLRYRVFYGLFDLDELSRLDQLRLFAHDRFGWFSFHERDHGDGAGSLKSWIERHLDRAGIETDGLSIRLLAFPRVLGYVFNPISVAFCYDRSGELIAIMHEVTNTFHERHSYLVDVEAGLSHEFDKELFVSPFIGMEARYQFEIVPPGASVAVSITQTDAEGELLRASFTGRRLELTDRNLLRVFFRYPLVTLKVIGGIHWEAVKLWVKGARYRRRPEPPRHEVTVVARRHEHV